LIDARRTAHRGPNPRCKDEVIQKIYIKPLAALRYRLYRSWMDIVSLERQLKKLERARVRLLKRAEARNRKLLMRLPKKVGLGSVEELIEALRGVTGKRKAALPPNGKRRRKRAVITDATRAKVKKLVQDGKTGSEVAKLVGISLPSVQNIKKALGLVKERK